MKNILMAIVSVLLLNGCSILWHGKKSQIRPNPELCSQSFVPPIIDVVGLSLAFTAAGLTTQLQVEQDLRYYLMAESIIAGTIFTLSSVSGFIASRQCEVKNINNGKKEEGQIN